MDVKRKIYNILTLLSIFCIANSAFAIEEVRFDADATTRSSKKVEINNNLLRPNEAPGIGTDPAKLQRYYRSLRDNRRTDENIKNSDNNVIDSIPIKLPARIQKNGATTRIEKVEITKSEFFTKREIESFILLVKDKEVSSEDLNNLINIINERYRQKGIVTARASLTEGAIKDGILRIDLMEARIGKILIEGNKFNRKWFLKRVISSKEGDILNLHTLEHDLKAFNKNSRSIQLSAQLRPGEEYGTTDVIIKAVEEFPYHFSASYDSFGRETTGLLRGGLMASIDSFVGCQDRLTGAINLSRSAQHPFVDYNVPINKKGTRVGASYIYGNNHVSSGKYKDFDLRAKTHIFSTYITHPLKDTKKYQLSLNSSANVKLSEASVLGYKYSGYDDYNIAVGLGGRYNFNKSVLFGAIYSTNGVIHDTIQSYTNFFTKVNADGYYIHYLPKGIIATIKAGGQYSPNNMPYIEQFQIGGISSVRGYSESVLLAPSSYFASLELLFPIPFLPERIGIPFKKDGTYQLRDSIKLATFIDNGAIFAHEGSVTTTNFLASVGAGIRVVVTKYITGRFYVGIPLINCGLYNQANARVHFDLIVSPF